MKKLSILTLALCAVALCSWASSNQLYEVKKVDLSSVNDSINFYLGYANGVQLKTAYLADNASSEPVDEFLNALTRGYEGKVERLSETQQVGKNLGQSIKEFETHGLANKATIAMKEPIFFQGLVNGLLNDSAMMPLSFAREFFETQFMAINPTNEDKVAAPVVGQCGLKAGKIKLTNLTDSLNYAFGFLNGNEIAMYVLANDSSKHAMQDFVAAINQALKSKFKNPQLVQMGEEIGAAIKGQEAEGLVGVPQLTTKFELIKQGFVNGLYQDTTQTTMDAASAYLQNEIERIKFSEQKTKNEQFLRDNANKQGVILTPSGLQYEVITLGSGPKPSATDNVKVHYHGTLIDGTVFDSSVERGEPISFNLSQVIAGWTEGVQLMPVGSKFRFFIPQELGYGSRSAGSIPPYSTLIFEVELLDIEK